MNLYSVTVKNRLGRRYGAGKVNVVKNEQEGVRYSILPGQDVQVSRLDDRVLLWSLKLEVEDPITRAAIPILIDSPGNYRVTVFQVDAKGKWKLEFKTPGKPAASEATHGALPFNVTIGRSKLQEGFSKICRFCHGFRFR